MNKHNAAIKKKRLTKNLLALVQLKKDEMTDRSTGRTWPFLRLLGRFGR